MSENEVVEEPVVIEGEEPKQYDPELSTKEDEMQLRVEKEEVVETVQDKELDSIQAVEDSNQEVYLAEASLAEALKREQYAIDLQDHYIKDYNDRIVNKDPDKALKVGKPYYKAPEIVEE
jgi:hypothetical protein